MSAIGSPARPPRDSGNSTLPPPSPSRADSDRFQLAENARLALEAKSAQVEGLKVKLAAAEAALNERDERDAETQRERASSTHAGVMDEADRLGDEMKGALGNVKAFMRRAWTGEKGHPNEDDSDAGDMNRHGTPSAMRSKAKTSIVEKPSARGAYVRHPDASPRVGFVGDREQRRLEKEGEVVADNARLRREVVELEQRLARLARVARSAHDAAESRFEEERRMRIDAEAAAERLRAASGDGSNALVEELETSRQLCRDVLLVTRACANVSQADPNAVVAALPALATLASNKRGDSALILATNGVPRHAAAAMETHGKDAQVATHACELIATLARGGEPSVLRGLAGSARKAAAAVAKQFTETATHRNNNNASPGPGVAIVNALRRHEGDAGVCAAAADATWAAAHHGGGSVAAKLLEHEAVSALARSMRSHPADADVVSKCAHAICCVASTSDANAAEAARQGGASAVAAARGDGGGDAIVAYPSTERWVAEAGGPGHESASRFDRRRSGGPTGDESWLVEYERGSGGRSPRSASTPPPPPRRRVEVVEEEEDDNDSGSFDFDGNL